MLKGMNLPIVMQKPIPPNTFETVVPPNKNYKYFEDCKDHPFLYDSNEFQMVNAWWLAEAATLAYAEPGFAVPRFIEAGLPEVNFFSGRSTQCYVAHNENFIVVAFSGSELRRREGSCDMRNIIADWLHNFNALPADFGLSHVHWGFKKALDEVWEPPDEANWDRRLKPYLDKIRDKGGRQRRVWFTGHSLGAALATLAAAKYGDVPALYTFGSPRVGDCDFRDAFRINTYRFVNQDDLVCKVPPPGLYRHVGDLRYIDNQGDIQDSPNLWEVLKDKFYRRYSHIFDDPGHFKSDCLWELPESCLTDHAPIYYAIHIWNNYAKAL